MLKKRFRLPSIRLKAENSFASSLFVLKKSRNQIGPRFAVVVPKAVDKRAVVRNKIKRVVRETISKNLDNEEKKDFLFIIRRAPKQLEDLRREVKKYLR